MAKEVITRLIDDLDGSEAAETVEFGLDGKGYTVDLSKKNAAALRKALKPYVEAGSPLRAQRRASGRAAARHSPDRLASIREWARKNGYDVADRGRIARDIQDAFDAAH